MAQMKCTELLAVLNEYVDGTVDPSICDEFEKHMAGCNPCQVVVDNIRKTITLYKNGQPCALPVEFENRLHTALRQRWKEVQAASSSRFDKEAAQWDDNPSRVALARALGEKIRQASGLKPGWRVLDYGAGTGLVTLSLSCGAAHVMAVDTSAGMLEMLDKKTAAAGIGNIQTRLWNLEAEPFPESGFDLAASSMTLHHLRDVPLVFRRLAALLKPGGKIAVADLDSEDGSFHKDTTGVYHSGFDRRDIEKWLGEAGFSRISIQDAHTIEKPGPCGGSRGYGVFLAVAVK